ncbi:MAG: DNA polymerase III subunit gamma/tau [Acidobacteria bacterium]|nr:DNA polymerase III subunit gamma/tau [Acidobacteriota bacterium]
MYQVIARKYRPQTFQQVVNQEHVKQTLENAIAGGRVAHGYIFAGQRGTGKTTVARILAKSLNCHKGSTATPCLECPSCKEIAASSSMDVIEIDAASNRGIDDVRELRENVRYRPARDRYKVFIIDEAHQITDAAFNALLKTLEEPPEWVVFMLCTTEAHKIPATIASRCQNFTFQMVDFEHVVGHMRWICEQEGIEAEPDALSIIALAGDGSIRDSLSTLDQAIASFGKTLHAGEVRQLLGVVSSEVLDEVSGALVEQSPARMLELVEHLTAQGQNPQHFCRELARFFRNLLVARVVGADSRLIAATGEERRRLSALAPQFSEEDLTRYLQLVLNLYRDLQHAPHPRFHLEMGLLKLVHAGRLVSIEKALAAASGRPGPPPAPPAGPARPQGVVRSGTHAAAQPPPAAVQSTRPAAARGFHGRLVEALREQGEEFAADAVAHSTVDCAEGVVTIQAPADQQFLLETADRTLTQAAERLLGRRAQIRVTLAEQTNRPANVSPPRGASEATARALAHPQVERFRAAFGGQVREVRDLKET